VKQLPFEISSETMYEIFGKHGAIRQIRMGNTPETKGRAFVVYEDIFDAQHAQKLMHGFNIQGRFLSVSFFKPPKKKTTAQDARLETEKTKKQLEELRSRYAH